MSRYDEERLGTLLRLLPPAPPATVAAAQELPFARAGLDEVVARAQADADFRARLVDDLDDALAAEGYEPDPAFVEALRGRLGGR
jgi:hypothetical protein